MAETVSSVVRANLKRLREERGWSQREVAEKLTQLTGERWSQVRVMDLEGGRGRDRQVSIDELAVLCPLHSVSLQELVTPSTGEMVQVGRNEVAGEVVAFFLRLTPAGEGYLDEQVGRLRDVTLGLFWNGSLTSDLLEKALGGDWVMYRDGEEGWVEEGWVGPTPEETEKARETIRAAYAEADTEGYITAITEDPDFWHQVAARRGSWGTSPTPDQEPFINFIARVLRQDDDKRKKGTE